MTSLPPRLLPLLAALFLLSLPAPAQVHSAFPNAAPIPVYTPSQRAAALQQSLHLAALPTLGAAVSVTPNAPYAPDGTHLDFWKPSFVLGTPSGGEAGDNFFGLHNDGHINLGFTAGPAHTYALDCRLLSATPITYKVFRGASATPAPQSAADLSGNHLLLLVPTPTPGEKVLVEMWPTPTTAVMGFLGCDLSPVIP